MDGYDIVRSVIYWIHAVAAVAWVGGSIFYLVVMRPALIDAAVANRALDLAINKGFRDVVDLSMISLVATGSFITFDRISSVPVNSFYFVTLGLKLTAVVCMFLMARTLGTRTGRALRNSRRPAPPPTQDPSAQTQLSKPSSLKAWTAPSRMILILGLITLFLSMVLARIYEHSLRVVS